MEGSDLILNGVIYLDGDVLIDDYIRWGEAGFSARMVREALAQFAGDVTVVVNSGGGHAWEGEAIRAALTAHPGKVTVRVAGVAMSAASLMIMSADAIEMTAGSILMIHDPSNITVGNAEEHQRAAAQLDQIADVYASVYAARAGITADAARAIMRAETYYGPEDAVAAGFADSVVDAADDPAAAEDAAMIAARQAFAASIAHLRMCAEQHSAGGQRLAAAPTATAGHPQAPRAATTEVHMDPEENPAVETPQTPATPPQPAPSQPTMSAPDTAAAERRGAEAERTRARAITEMARPFMASGQVSQTQIDALIDDGTPAAQAGNRLLAAMASAEPPVVPSAGGTARITRDETDTRTEGLVQALMRNYDGPGQQFRGITLSGVAMELAGGRGYDRVQQIQRGMRATSMMGGAHGVSDFAYITTEVMNRTLIAEYDRRGANWDVVAGTPMSASDFRELHAVRFGGDFQLKTVKENGEYQEATLNDEAEGLTVERRGRTIHLTFEAVVNDDMGALNRIPREFAIAARVMESSMVWKLVRTNAALKSDSTALFHADHGNLASSGAAISVATVGAGRKRMWEQTAYGAKDEEDFLQVTPDTLIVPPALEVTALQFVAGITPSKTSDANPYRNTLSPVVVPNLGVGVTGGSDTAWYLASSDLPPISVAYLEGYESPTVQTIEGMNPDRVTMNARHIFGAAASEFRGIDKNPGT